jgi:hypothetical protein
MNKIILALWIKDKIKTLSTKVTLVNSSIECGHYDQAKQDELTRECHNMWGRLDALKELYEEFNLEDVELDELEYHITF